MEQITTPNPGTGIIYTANTQDGTSTFAYKDGDAKISVTRKWDNVVYTLRLTLRGTPVNAVDAYASMRGGLFASVCSIYKTEMLAAPTHAAEINIGFGDFVRNAIAPTTRNVISTGKVVAALRNAEKLGASPEVLALLKGLMK